MKPNIERDLLNPLVGGRGRIIGHGVQIARRDAAAKHVANEAIYVSLPADRVTRQQERRLAVKGAKRLNQSMRQDAAAAELAIHRQSADTKRVRDLDAAAEDRRKRRQTPSRVSVAYLSGDITRHLADINATGIYLNSHARQVIARKALVEATPKPKAPRKSRAKAKPADVG